MKSDERRKSPRYEIPLKVSLHARASQKNLEGQSRDISPWGLFARLPEVLPANEDVELTIHDGGSGAGIVVHGIVVYALPGVGNGIEFKTPTRQITEAISKIIRKLKGRSKKS